MEIEWTSGLVPTERNGREVDEGFEAFFNEEQLALFRALCAVTGDAQEAEDAVQTAFIKIWGRWDRVIGLDNKKGYLYKTALNEYLQLRRAAARRASRAMPWKSRPDQLAAVEARDEVARALMSLPLRQRAALVATELLELDSNEAGRLLGVRAGTVRRLASEGRRRLKDTVGHEERTNE